MGEEGEGIKRQGSVCVCWGGGKLSIVREEGRGRGGGRRERESSNKKPGTE